MCWERLRWMAIERVGEEQSGPQGTRVGRTATNEHSILCQQEILQHHRSKRGGEQGGGGGGGGGHWRGSGRVSGSQDLKGSNHEEKPRRYGQATRLSIPAWKPT
jgi:hypothetical protein